MVPLPTRAQLGSYVYGLLLFFSPSLALSLSLSLSLSLFFFSLSLSLIADYYTQIDTTNTSVICCIGQSFETKRRQILRYALKMIGSNAFTRIYIHRPTPLPPSMCTISHIHHSYLPKSASTFFLRASSSSL